MVIFFNDTNILTRERWEIMATESCVKIETQTTEAKYILRKCVKIYYSTILNRNRIVFCFIFGRTFTVKNGQFNEFITVVNVKSKVK